MLLHHLWLEGSNIHFLSSRASIRATCYPGLSAMWSSNHCCSLMPEARSRSSNVTCFCSLAGRSMEAGFKVDDVVAHAELPDHPALSRPHVQPGIQPLCHNLRLHVLLVGHPGDCRSHTSSVWHLHELKSGATSCCASPAFEGLTVVPFRLLEAI